MALRAVRSIPERSSDTMAFHDGVSFLLLLTLTR